MIINRDDAQRIAPYHRPMTDLTNTPADTAATASLSAAANIGHAAIKAQAHIHHAYLLGLQLMIATRKGPDVMGDWMFRLFRRQHLDKFLSSFDKLGLTGEPDAVACAKYHVLSNNMGGVGVEFMPETDRKAWVRFRYPRWMYAGPTICGVPVEVSRGFLRGWYAHNGVSLGNPRLGFVCVSEDMTGEFGFCGYFKDYDHDLTDDERLQFDKGEVPPPFDPSAQPAPPAGEWSAERLEKANRNYALGYIQNGISELIKVIGPDDTKHYGQMAAKLIGLNYFPETAAMIGAQDGSLDDGVIYLARMFAGMGDEVTVDGTTIRQSNLRILRGLEGEERAILTACWIALWEGACQSQQLRKELTVAVSPDQLVWHLTST